MSTNIQLVFTVPQTVADIKARAFPVDSGSPHKVLNRLQYYVGSLLAKHRRASFTLQVQNGDGAAASGTVTFASALAADTVTIGGTVLTAHASTQDATHFKVGVSNTADAAALATCVNANTTLNKYVSAAAASGVCTITCLVKGTVGNGISLASSNGGRLAVSAANFASGADDTATITTYHAGL